MKTIARRAHWQPSPLVNGPTAGSLPGSIIAHTPSRTDGAYNLPPVSEEHSILEATPTRGTNPLAPGSDPSVSFGDPDSGSAVRRVPLLRKRAPSYDELQRSLVKFYLQEDGRPTSSTQWSVLNISNCEGGVEIIERALKKFNKSSIGKIYMDTDDEHTEKNENGSLIVDGWGLFPGGPQNEISG
jgi:mitogen-activated protein kinase kinase kinase